MTDHQIIKLANQPMTLEIMQQKRQMVIAQRDMNLNNYTASLGAIQILDQLIAEEMQTLATPQPVPADAAKPESEPAPDKAE